MEAARDVQRYVDEAMAEHDRKASEREAEREKKAAAREERLLQRLMDYTDARSSASPATSPPRDPEEEEKTSPKPAPPPGSDGRSREGRHKPLGRGAGTGGGHATLQLGRDNNLFFGATTRTNGVKHSDSENIRSLLQQITTPDNPSDGRAMVKFIQLMQGKLSARGYASNPAVAIAAILRDLSARPDRLASEAPDEGRKSNAIHNFATHMSDKYHFNRFRQEWTDTHQAITTGVPESVCDCSVDDLVETARRYFNTSGGFMVGNDVSGTVRKFVKWNPDDPSPVNQLEMAHFNVKRYLDDEGYHENTDATTSEEIAKTFHSIVREGFEEMKILEYCSQEKGTGGPDAQYDWKAVQFALGEKADTAAAWVQRLKDAFAPIAQRYDSRVTMARLTQQGMGRISHRNRKVTLAQLETEEEEDPSRPTAAEINEVQETASRISTRGRCLTCDGKHNSNACTRDLKRDNENDNPFVCRFIRSSRMGIKYGCTLGLTANLITTMSTRECVAEQDNLGPEKARVVTTFTEEDAQQALSQHSEGLLPTIDKCDNPKCILKTNSAWRWRDARQEDTKCKFLDELHCSMVSNRAIAASIQALQTAGRIRPTVNIHMLRSDSRLPSDCAIVRIDAMQDYEEEEEAAAAGSVAETEEDPK
jgi:hypothetical protein